MKSIKKKDFKYKNVMHMYSGLALGCFCMTFCHVCYSNFSSFYILIYPLKKMFGLESCPPSLPLCY